MDQMSGTGAPDEERTSDSGSMTDPQVRERTLLTVARMRSVLLEGSDDWIELFADDAVLEWPFAPDGRKQTYRGTAAIRRALTPALARADFLSVQYFKVHPMLDPNGVVLEMGTKARFVPTGRPYDQTYVFVVQMRDGRIWRYREYWNAWTLQDAWGDRDDLDARWSEPDPEPHDRPYLTD